MSDLSSRGQSVRTPGAERTYWNGESCDARKVRVVVADEPDVRLYWARPFVGTERDAIEVSYYGQTFYLDDEGHEQSQEILDYLGEAAESCARMLGDRTTVAEQRERLGADEPNVGSPGWGWRKVTAGRGAPHLGHSSLSVSSVRPR